MKKKTKSQSEIILEYFKRNPKKEIKHPEVVDWAEAEYKKLTGNKFRDPDRAIRKFHQQGILQKIEKGIYLYDPELVTNPSLEDFSEKMKREILRTGDFKCAICGKGKKEGEELHVDHIRPKDKGGKATIENGQVLCSQHNFIKKNLNQTETSKKLFINLYKLAKKEKNKKLLDFCNNVLEVFEEHEINGHILWKK